MCGNCLDRLEVSYAIKQKSIESDKKIKEKNAHLFKNKKLEIISHSLKISDTVYLNREVKLTKIKKPKISIPGESAGNFIPFLDIVKVEGKVDEAKKESNLQIFVPPPVAENVKTVETSLESEEVPENDEDQVKNGDSDNDSVSSRESIAVLSGRKRRPKYLRDPDYHPVGVYVKKGRGGSRRTSKIKKSINSNDTTPKKPQVESIKIKTEPIELESNSFSENQKSVKLEMNQVFEESQQKHQENLNSVKYWSRRKKQNPELDLQQKQQTNLKRKHEFFDVPGALFYCPVCKRPFFSESRMLNHKRLAHDVERNFHCKLCNKSFITPYVLQQHVDTKHSENRPYECIKANCKKAFKTENGLKIHSLVHIKIKKFFCKVCSAKFHSAQGLILHSQRFHQIDLYFKDVMKTYVIQRGKRKLETS